MYHIYNRGNNRELIFFGERNFEFFIRKLEKHIVKHVDLLAYCLMPNHFHLLVNTRETFVHKKFSADLRIMLSSYTRAIHKQENRSGSLFQQHTKIKKINSSEIGSICLHYIHQNPLKAGLVDAMEDWHYSSFNTYWKQEDRFVDRLLANKLLDIPLDTERFYTLSKKVINHDKSSYDFES